MKKACITLLVLLCLRGTVLAAEYDELTAVGRAVGIRMQENGITITGFTEVGGAEQAGLRIGDKIVAVNGQPVNTASEIGKLMTSDGAVAVTVERNGSRADYLLNPVAVEGRWLLGLRIRDSISGIGTITFYDRQSGAYGALGHGVCAGGNTELLPVIRGEVVDATVTSVERGRCGTAGQLRGEFDRNRRLGSVSANTKRGIFGTLEAGQNMGETYLVASNAEVRTGNAVILSNVSGREVQRYDVEILKLYPNEEERNILLKVTDPTLLSQTGGVVQGMSGSPILQDGRIVGAVTHVLVNDPTTGYGIFIENMLDAAA